MTKRIEVFQSFRFIAFLLIFIWHLNGYMGISVTSHAQIAVSFFIIISGFLNCIYIENDSNYNSNVNYLRKMFNYARTKIKKIYPLYIVTIILFIPLSFKNLVLESNVSIIIYMLCVIANIFLLEAWFPKNFDSISYAGWYLSILVFLQFITIPLNDLYKRVHSKINSNILIIAAVFILFLMYTIFVGNEFYFYYNFPLYRIFEYFIGFILGKMYLNGEYKKMFCDKKLSTFIEIITILVCLIVYNLFYSSSNYGVHSVVEMLVIMTIIFVFSHEAGYISNLLKNKFLINSGNISGELYLIHNLFIAYLLGIITRIVPHGNFVVNLLVFTLTFILSYITSYFIHYRKDYFKCLKRN